MSRAAPKTIAKWTTQLLRGRAGATEAARQLALRAYDRQDAAALDVLRTVAATSSNPATASAAIYGLGLLGHRGLSSAAIVVDALTSADSTVVLQAIRTLWNIGDEQTCAKRLLVLQEHQDDEIQREAMRLLEHLTGDTGYRALVRRPTNLVSRDTPFDDARYESPKTISVLGPGRHL